MFDENSEIPSILLKTYDWIFLMAVELFTQTFRDSKWNSNDSQ